MQHIITPSLAADANESALDKLDKFLAKHHPFHAQRVNKRNIDAAYQVGGRTLARAHQVYISWFNNIRNINTICLFDTDVEKQLKDKYTGCLCGQFPFEHRSVLLDYEQTWSLSCNHRTKELRFRDELSNNFIYPDESLEQLFVGHLLMQWFASWPGVKNIWLDAEVLHDPSQWELLWHRPSYIYGPCIFYLHISGEVALVHAGQCRSEGPYFLFKDTCGLSEDILHQHADIPPEFAQLPQQTEPIPVIEFCARCMS